MPSGLPCRIKNKAKRQTVDWHGELMLPGTGMLDPKLAARWTEKWHVVRMPRGVGCIKNSNFLPPSSFFLYSSYPRSLSNQNPF